MKIESIFEIESENDFNEIALHVFHYQYQNIQVYKSFVDYLQKDLNKITHYSEIPFLPISFFKSHTIISQDRKPKNHFQSSGTTGQIRSKHYFEDTALYQKSTQTSYEYFIGKPEEQIIIGLLPNYLENPNSSLIHMVESLMSQSADSHNGYYLDDFALLNQTLQSLESSPKKIVLFGVSFALLDFIEQYQPQNKNLIIIETGGMKGRISESTKPQVLDALQRGFPNAIISSEYGMTELFSQAYAVDRLFYTSPNWMKVLIREIEDPQSYVELGKTGAMNIIDLANYYSCSFIATEDLGRKSNPNEFEIIGRLDQSELRGCSLLYTES